MGRAGRDPKARSSADVGFRVGLCRILDLLIWK